MSEKLNRKPIKEYNNNFYDKLDYDENLKVLFYKDREIPWKTNKSTIKNKKSDELKTYEYITVVIPDINNKKHKIFKNKFLKFIEETDKEPEIEEVISPATKRNEEKAIVEQFMKKEIKKK
jgi:hypothetical protein